MRDDLLFALRTLRRSPLFTAVAILSLALGIGANTAIFSLFDQVILRGLPVREPGRLVVFHLPDYLPGRGTADNRESIFPHPAYKMFRDRTRAFEGVIARYGAPVSVSEGRSTELGSAEIVSGNYFQVLGVRPFVGRAISPADDGAPGASPVAMLSYAFWNRRFGADRAVVGRKILVNGNPFTIIGVVEQGFHGMIGGYTPELFVPIAMKRQITPTWDGLEDFQSSWLTVFARLRPGVSPEQARTDAQGVLRQILEEIRARIGRMRSPQAEREFLATKIGLLPAAQGVNQMRNEYQTALSAVMAMCGLVLLITCANVAGLLAARGAARRKEIAVRLAIGAGRGAIARQLLVESLLLAIVGGLLGLLVGRWGVLGLLRLMPGSDTESWLSASIDTRVLGFNLLVSLATGALFGLFPAIQAARAGVAGALRDRAEAGSGAGQARFRRALVVAQVALSLLLLVGAGLFARSVSKLMSVDTGFRAGNVLTFAVNPTLAGYPDARVHGFYRELQRRIEALPGVEALGGANPGTLAHSDRGTGITVEGYREKENEDTGARAVAAGPGYFRALGVALVRGRDFTDRDLTGARKYAVVNEAFVKEFFAGRDPLGRHVAFERGPKVVPDREIVGVVRNFKHGDLREEPRSTVFFPYTQDDPGMLTFYVRGKPDIAGAIRGIVRDLDPNIPVYDLKPMSTRVEESIFADRLIAMLAAAFGALATVLAALGLYGVIAYTVARRTSEIGVRMALGAPPMAVLSMIMREVGLLVAAGLVIGFPAALALSRYVQSQLFGIRANDAAVFAAALLGLAAVGLTAGLVPARRAAAIDPITALRYE